MSQLSQHEAFMRRAIELAERGRWRAAPNPTVGAVLSDILPYLGVEKCAEEGYAVLDDLTGLTAREAETILKGKKLTALLSGEGGTVVSQIPQAGQCVPGGSRILLYLGE